MTDPLDLFDSDYTPDPERGLDSPDMPPVGYGQTPAPARVETYPIARTQIRRDVFWQNVCREILMGLAAAAAESSGRVGTGPSDAQMSGSPVSDLFDGRMGIITAQGQRIPIADVYPVFAMSVPGNAETRSRSNDVQCTVFRITTPTGESYTLPLSHIVGVHTISESLIEQLEAADEDKNDENRVPFGFGAYTSLANSEQIAHQGASDPDESPGEPDENPEPAAPPEPLDRE